MRLRRYLRHRSPPKDFFGNLIEVGDRYLYGVPMTFGRVIKIRVTSIMLDTGVDWNDANTTMNCKSPALGVCLDKVPEE